MAAGASVLGQTLVVEVESACRDAELHKVGTVPRLILQVPAEVQTWNLKSAGETSATRIEESRRLPINAACMEESARIFMIKIARTMGAYIFQVRK